MYRKIVVNAFNDLSAINVEEYSLNALREELKTADIFLVKVHAAPVNPLDLLKISGSIFTVKTPFTPGSEGSGEIIEGQDKTLIGRKVSFTSPVGSWSEYCIVPRDSMLLLEGDAEEDLDAASVGYINPLTAVGLVSRAIELNAKGIVNLAATSALGKMVNDYAKQKGLACLNVIRGDAERIADIQKHFNNENVISLDGDAQAFQKTFKEASERLAATVSFDPIGGAVTGQVFNNLPPNSTVICYGSLSGKDIEGINGVQVRWANKKLEGFAIFSWFATVTAQKRDELKKTVVQQARTTFATPIETSFPFKNVQAAVALLKTLKGGKKIILKP